MNHWKLNQASVKAVHKTFKNVRDSDQGVFRTLSDILDGAFYENSERLRSVNYFHKTLHVRGLIGFSIRLM